MTVVDPAGALGLDERATVAETALRTMGLTEGFAPIVLLCGHGATTAANAHAASARLRGLRRQPRGPERPHLAAILNDDEARAELRARGIAIGEGTWFGAAEHDTTTDEVTLLDAHRALTPTGARSTASPPTWPSPASGRAERMTRLPGGLGRTATPRTATAKRAAAASPPPPATGPRPGPSGVWLATPPSWSAPGISPVASTSKAAPSSTPTTPPPTPPA